MAAAPALPLRANSGNWKTQIDSLLTAKERELVLALASLRQEAADLERELAELRAIKRLAGVATEVRLEGQEALAR